MNSCVTDNIPHYTSCEQLHYRQYPFWPSVNGYVTDNTPHYLLWTVMLQTIPRITPMNSCTQWPIKMTVNSCFTTKTQVNSCVPYEHLIVFSCEPVQTVSSSTILHIFPTDSVKENLTITPQHHPTTQWKGVLQKMSKMSTFSLWMNSFVSDTIPHYSSKHLCYRQYSTLSLWTVCVHDKSPNYPCQQPCDFTSPPTDSCDVIVSLFVLVHFTDLRSVHLSKC